ncbi:hypothetical protein IMSAGC019_01251 [Lachnospiraceae bacterium]|nr:hypothetical protein IMSAGC019_01251 [Lachnospiraceae bacterium]
MNNTKNNGAANSNSNNEGGRFIMANGTIRTMEAFAETVKSAMEAVYGSGYSISIQPVTKNNGTHLTGLTIRQKGINIAPTIYLESLFAGYQDGLTMEAVCKEVMRLYEQNKEAQGFDSSMVTDFNQAKDRICFKLVNAEKNRELLAGIPYIPYHDLAVVFYILVPRGHDGTETILVRNSFMDAWGADTQTIYPIAMENTQRIFRGRVQSMESVMMEMMEDMLDAGDSGEFYDMPAVTEDVFPMYVASNYDRLNGASVFLYPNLLRDFAECIGSDFYILPSSVHELIFLPDTDGMDVGYMKMMVRQINGSEVAEDEVLSDNVYFYSRASDRVEMV